MTEVEKERHFISEERSDVTTLFWKIKNVIKLAETKDAFNSTTLEVNAGESIGLPSQWSFRLNLEENADINGSGVPGVILGLGLKMIKSPPGNPNVLANFHWNIMEKNGSVRVGGSGKQFDGDVFNVTNDYSEPSLITMHSTDGMLKNTFVQYILTQGCLPIRIRFSVFGKKPVVTEEIGTSTAAKFNDKGRLEILDDLETLLNSGENADIIIKVKGGKTLKAHKAILGVRSPVFLAMFQNKMTERSTGEVFIDDFSYEGMSIILKFIYSGTLDGEWVEFFQEVVDAAEKYSLTLLKHICDETLANGCNTENALDLLKLARLYNLKVAEERIYAFVVANVRDIL